MTYHAKHRLLLTMPVDRDLSSLSRITSPRIIKGNVPFATILSVDKARSCIEKSRSVKFSWGDEQEKGDGDIVSMITDDDQTDFAFSVFSTSSSSDYGIINSGLPATIAHSHNADMVRYLSCAARSTECLYLMIFKKI